MVVPECISNKKCSESKDDSTLLILPGSPNMRPYVRYMNSILSKAGASPMNADVTNMPICMREMLQATAISYNLDYMLLDMGTTSSDGNFGVFYSCDGFVVPANADHLSKMSLSSLLCLLKRWNTDYLNMLIRYVRINHVSPKFLGVAFCKVPTSKRGPNKLNQAFMDETLTYIRSAFLPALKELDMWIE